MMIVSANELKNNLFKYLDKISNEEKIIIHKDNWRSKMSIQPKLLVPTHKIIEPMTDIWEGSI